MSYYDRTQPFFFWDTDGSGANPIGRYQVVSLANPTEIAAIAAAGALPPRVGFGDVVVRTPITAGIASRVILGVTDTSGWSLGLPSAEPVSVLTDGIAKVQFTAALAADPGQLLTATLAETRTSSQTPFTNNYDMLIPVDSRFSLTYQLTLAGALTIVPTTGAGTNVEYYPLGFMLDTPGAKYDILRIDMTRCPRVIYA